jgi:hypothetical protein
MQCINDQSGAPVNLNDLEANDPDPTITGQKDETKAVVKDKPLKN